MGGGAVFTPTNSFLLLGFLSVLILVKIDQEMRPCECAQTDTQTDRCKPVLQSVPCYKLQLWGR